MPKATLPQTTPVPLFGLIEVDPRRFGTPRLPRLQTRRDAAVWLKSLGLNCTHRALEKQPLTVLYVDRVAMLFTEDLIDLAERKLTDAPRIKSGRTQRAAA